MLKVEWPHLLEVRKDSLTINNYSDYVYVRDILEAYKVMLYIY